jgi:transposase
MQELGEGDPIYVADSALVTEDNLDLLADEEKGSRFITRLPRTYKECREVVAHYPKGRPTSPVIRMIPEPTCQAIKEGSAEPPL